MLSKSKLKMLVMVLALFLSACAGGTVPEEAASEIPEAVAAVQQELSNLLNVPVDEIVSFSYTQEEWTDSCLGLGTANESCAAVITPGWRVVLEVDGTEYIYRTDMTGQTIRREQ